MGDKFLMLTIINFFFLLVTGHQLQSIWRAIKVAKEKYWDTFRCVLGNYVKIYSKSKMKIIKVIRVIRSNKNLPST